MSSLTIRPVTARWPSSSSLWEETSLPLACVIQPCSEIVVGASSSALRPPLLSSIPKCLHCGAPQQDATHTPVHGGTSILCHLCSKVTSRVYEDQVNGRPSEQLSQELYTRRGSLPQQHEFSLPLYDNIYSLPAMACPPIWWIVVDGTTVNQHYWNTVGTALNNVCDSMPSYIHVGLLVATPFSLAVWDLSSAVPHVKHLEWNQLGTITQLPLSPNKSNLQAALRALGDSTTTTTSSTKRNTINNTMPLGDTIQVILDTMQSHTHPGNTATTNERPTYAGGKITCILSGDAPVVKVKSIRNDGKQHQVRRRRGDVGTGGVGGSCAVIGQRYTSSSGSSAMSNDTINSDDVELGGTTLQATRKDNIDNKQEPTDMTATNLAKLYHYDNKSHPEVYFAELGKECGRAGFGVDVLVLSEKNEDVGIPFLRQLSDRSGAPGPLLITNPNDFELQLSSKTPWASSSSLVFGGTLRVRTSPGFQVDDSEVEGSHGDGPQLAPLYSSGGLMGPASVAQESLWNLGTCDAYTAVTIDLTVNKSVKDRVYVDGMGDCAIKHSIQTCFAYTAIVQDESGKFVTVRRLSIASLNLPLAHDTESLYATLDPEALAVMLFHKLTIASLQDGLIAAHDIGQEWLTSLMSCVYRSALEEEELQKEQLSRGLDNMNPVFYPQERLLNHGGDLSVQDVLLGQGHERLNTVALIVFALLQCDALRPSFGNYHPSVDARSAASAQMYSMTPSVLSRCVAPRIELWASHSDDKEPIVEDLDLNLEHVGFSIMEHRQTARDPSSDLILLVDTPREILVVDSRHLQSSSSNNSTASKLEIGKGLERCIEIAAKSYRVAPPIVYAMDVTSSSSTFPLARVKDVLVEDSQTVQGLENFEQWKQEVAAMVQEGLGLS